MGNKRCQGQCADNIGRYFCICAPYMVSPMFMVHFRRVFVLHLIRFKPGRLKTIRYSLAV